MVFIPISVTVLLVVEFSTRIRDRAVIGGGIYTRICNRTVVVGGIYTDIRDRTVVGGSILYRYW